MYNKRRKKGCDREKERRRKGNDNQIFRPLSDCLSFLSMLNNERAYYALVTSNR